MKNILQVSDLRVSYGAIQAIKGIDLRVGEGEMVALIGANGAGKTSTLKALMRMLPWAGGSARYQGRDLASLPQHRLTYAGLTMVPEGRGVFARLTVEENLEMGAFSRKGHAEILADIERMYGLFPRLRERRRGSVINNASSGIIVRPKGDGWAALRPDSREQPYMSSKAALANLTFYLADEVTQHNVAANIVIPGHTRTTGTDEQARARMKLSGRAGRDPVRPEHTVPLVRFLNAPLTS